MPVVRDSKLSLSFVLMHDKETPILATGQEARFTIAPPAIPKDQEKAKEMFLGLALQGAERLWDKVVKETWFP